MKIEVSRLNSIKPTMAHGLPIRLELDVGMTDFEMHHFFCLIWEWVGDDELKRWVEMEQGFTLNIPETRLCKEKGKGNDEN